MGKGYKGKNPRGAKPQEAEENFDYRAERGQAATVGMMPPSSSDDESVEAKPRGQNPNVGEMPPSDSDDSSSSDDEGEAKARQPVQQEAPRRRKGEDEPDPEQIAKDMERLALIRKKREDERLKRIEDEGWDRYAPLSDINKPPPPADHPGRKQ